MTSHKWNVSFVAEELEPGQPYRLENGLEITSVKKPKKCVKKVRAGTEENSSILIRLVKASHGDIVVLHYVGRTQGPEGEIFDDTKSKGFPFKFELGGGRSIKGLDLGMRGVCKGEQREIFVPSDLA